MTYYVVMIGKVIMISSTFQDEAYEYATKKVRKGKKPFVVELTEKEIEKIS